MCHVAAQYGQTAALYHLALKWGADTDSPDNDGRTPLHWAAYKGFADTLRLLLVLGSRATLPDKEGCTPLHWAAIRGHTEACTVLLQVRGGGVAGGDGRYGGAHVCLCVCVCVVGRMASQRGCPCQLLPLFVCPPVPRGRRAAGLTRCFRRTAPAARPRSWRWTRGTACWACTSLNTSSGRCVCGGKWVGWVHGGVHAVGHCSCGWQEPSSLPLSATRRTTSNGSRAACWACWRGCTCRPSSGASSAACWACCATPCCVTPTSRRRTR